MRYGYIYLTKNLINDKIYIGQKKSIKYIPYYYGSGKAIKLALKKYGKNNFICNILCWVNATKNNNKDQQRLNKKEKKYIKHYMKMYSPEILYNISDGGNCNGSSFWKKKWKEPEFRQKMLLSRNSKEYKLKLSKLAKEQWADPNSRKKKMDKIQNNGALSGERNPFYNKKHTQESIKKNREATKLRHKQGKYKNLYAKKYKCKYCKKKFMLSNFAMWHGEKCKQKGEK